MRKLLVGAALIVTSLPALAMAQDAGDDRGAYLGVEAGIVLPGDFDTDIGPTIEDARSSGEPGWGVAAILGYDWGPIRTEVEASHQSFGADQINSQQEGIPSGANGLATGAQDCDGDFSLTSLMANALVDFGNADDVQFSLGAGVGRTWMDVDAALAGSAATHLDTSDSEWA